MCVCVCVCTANTAPVVAVPIPDQNAIPTLPFAYTVPISTFFDPDVGDSLRCAASVPRLSVNPDGSTSPYRAALPAWLSFDATAKAFSGTPAYLDVELIDVVLDCVDIFGAGVTAQFALNILGLSFLPGYPRIKRGTQVRTFSCDIVLLLNGTWKRWRFARERKHTSAQVRGLLFGQ